MFNAVFSVTLAEGANAEQYVADAKAAAEAVSPVFLRSEERRVGKECL